VKLRSMVKAQYIAGMAVLCLAGVARAQSCTSNAIVCENLLPGSTGWQISGSGDASIQGFATDISVNAGQTVSFKVKTTASNYRLDIYRMGYYGGAGARKVTTINPSVSLPQTQPACITDSTTNLMDCGNWAVSASWLVPSTAVSGIYFAVPVRADTGGASHIFFIVRNDASHSDIMFQTSDETWQAYNPYGGHSLYGDTTWNLPNRAYKVSYNRPFNTANLETLTWVFNAEYPMVRWLEANGYDVSYFTGVDAARNGALILNHKTYISVGHDEYWSAPHRTNVEAARSAGVNLAFFSGNEVFWKTRWEAGADGSNYRTLVCYKETLDGTPSGGVKDPLDPPTWTGTWRDPRFSPPADGGRPENSLTGTIFTVNGPGTDNTNLALAVPAADGKMRFWRNTSIANLGAGQTATLPAGTLGYEWDSDLDNGARPPGLFHLSTTTQNLTTDLLLDYGATYGAGTTTHNLTTYRAPSGALVFGAGTVQWAWGLDSNHDNGSAPADIRMQQATMNLFADMGVQPQTLQPGLVAATKSTDFTAPISTITSPASGSTVPFGVLVTVTGTAIDLGGGVVGGVEVSVDGGLTWHPATGRENWTYSWATAIPNTGHIMSRSVDDSGNLEPSSAGVNVTVPRPVSSITLDTTAFGDSSTPSTTVRTSAFSTAGNNELLLAFVSADYLSGANTTVTGVTGGGLTWTLVKRTNAQSGTAEIWRAFAPSPLSNIAVTATLSQTVAASISVQAYAGVDTSGTGGAGAIGAVSSGSASSGAPTAQLVTTRNNSLVVGVGTDYDNPIARVPAAGQTLVHQDFTPTGDTYWVQTMSFPTPAAGTTVTMSDTQPTGDRYNLAICEILPTTAPTWTISGTVSPASSGSGTVVTLSGPSSATATADGSGNYNFSGLTSGSYTVTPSKTNFTFAPGTQTVAVNGANVGAVNFTAVPVPTFSASGNVGPASLGAGATLSITATGEGGGSFSPVTADGSGNYTFNGLPNNTYKVTPTKSGFTFTPASQNIAVNGASLTGINFTAQASAVPPVISVVTAAPGSTSATITWTTNVASSSRVNYGTSSGSLALSVSDPTLVTAHSLSLPSLAATTTYFYTVTSVDGVGNSATSPALPNPPSSFTTLVSTPPVLSALTAVPGAGGTATIAWTTNIATNSRIDYGTTSASLTLNASNPAFVTAHSITIAGLTNGSTYFFRVTSTDASNNSATLPPTASAPASFVENAPFSVWSAAATPGTPNDPDISATETGMKFRSDVAGFITGVRFYKGSLNTGTHVGNLWTSTGVLLATVIFSGETASGWQQANFAAPVAINPATTYVISYFSPVGEYSSDGGFFAATGVDTPPLHALANGVDGVNGVFVYNTASAFPNQSFNSTNYWVDVVFSTGATVSAPPVISTVTATLGSTTATIAWTTDVPSSSRVDYGTSSGALTLNMSDVTLLTAHSLNLTGLTAGTAYFYTVTSVNAANISATSPASPNPPASFTTTASGPPVISNLTAVAGPNGSATIAWSTNTASSSHVDYGTTSTSLTLNANNAALVTSHSLTLSGLTAGTTYFYRATSTDAFSNSATSPPLANTAASFVENATATVSIWTTAQTPGTIDSADNGAVELGMKFRSDVAGYVSGLRFYKGANNTGTHTGNLWSSTGTLLATVTFTNETASGWQSANFATPVLISLATTYIISYYAPVGRYSDTASYFNGSNGDNPPLHALANGVDGGNGVYLYGPQSAFPSQTFNSSNYWVDVLFTTTTTTVFPVSTVIETGTLSAGTAAGLNADDNVYYQLASTTAATRASAWYGSFPAVPKMLTNLKVTYKGKDSRSCTEAVSIWNFTTSAWVQLDSRAVTTTEILRGPLVPSGALASYVSGTSGTGELRVEVKCSTTAGIFTTSADLMSITYGN
jgi:hypothetical protein